MIQFLFKLILCVLLAIAAAFAYLAVKSGDPLYAFYEWMSPARFHQYDPLIRSVALEHHLDPVLVKAVVWRESRFDPKKHGTHGERGLMQVSERAAEFADGRYLLICTSGRRSGHAARLLRGEGIQNVYSLAGGLNALRVTG